MYMLNMIDVVPRQLYLDLLKGHVGDYTSIVDPIEPFDVLADHRCSYFVFLHGSSGMISCCYC